MLKKNHLPDSEIELQINGDAVRVTAPCTVAGLLVHLELGEKRVAVALNRDVVLRGHYHEIELADADRVEILEAVGGG